MRLGIAGLLLLVALESPCLATGLIVVDQSHAISSTNSGLFVESSFFEAQTFRVGVGGRLASVHLGVYRRQAVAQPLVVDIVRTQGGEPLFTPEGVLATRSVNGSSVPLITGFDAAHSPYFSVVADFSSSSIPVHAGDVLAVVLRSDAPEFNGFTWWTAPNGYANGSGYSLRRSDSFFIGHPDLDAQFATSVAVPEPAGLTLSALAVGGAMRALRRRVRRV